jgi:hypothetical protein
MRARVLLIAALVLVLAGTGAVAYVAANDDDPQSTALAPGSPQSAAIDPAGAPPTDTQPAPAPQQPAPEQSPPPTGTNTAPAPSPDEPSLGDDSGSGSGSTSSSGSGGVQKTHFKREPKKQPQDDEPDRNRFAVPPAQQFSGEGNASLGTVDVKANSILKWKARGRLEIRFGREAFPIVAPTKSGQLVLPPFLFTKVRVLAAGPWKITINPQ